MLTYADVCFSGKLSEALAAFEEAAARDPAHAEAHNALAGMLTYAHVC